MIEWSAGVDTAREVRHPAEVPQDKEFHFNEFNDEEWRRIFAPTCDVLNVTQEQAEEAYAEFFYKDGLTRWPMWSEMAKNAREFLLHQPKIPNGFATSRQHPALRSAIDDGFDVEECDDELVVHYESPNRLCGSYMGLARGIINRYGESAVVEEECCAKNGASDGEIHVRWS